MNDSRANQGRQADRQAGSWTAQFMARHCARAGDYQVQGTMSDFTLIKIALFSLRGSRAKIKRGYSNNSPRTA